MYLNVNFQPSLYELRVGVLIGLSLGQSVAERRGIWNPVNGREFPYKVESNNRRCRTRHLNDTMNRAANNIL
jgi:hypothetical protein